MSTPDFVSGRVESPNTEQTAKITPNPMRAPETEATGTAGASEVIADFERLGWGVAENLRHDLGTDLFLQVRDERRFDLGLIIGAQVKSGPSYFDEPKHDEAGELVGWWFRDADRAHINAWLKHALPHVVVLHDMETRASYWAHVTAEAVVSTGKGAKLLVPADQSVSAEQRHALLEVAKSQRPSVPWEGSIWTAGSEVPSAELLRHALVVPRLVAPHPNAGTGGGLMPEQAVAMLVQGRVDEFDRFAREHPGVPTRDETHGSDDWRWRFAGAIAERVTTMRLEKLTAAVNEAPTPGTRAAAVVSAAAALTESARPEESLELLTVELGRDEAEPVDHAWLLMQRARASAEIGKLEEARADAIAVMDVRATAPSDATATALAGAASNLLFDTSTWGQRDLEQAITSADTAASWWRQQTAAGGLTASVEHTFMAWAGGTRGADATHLATNKLTAASLLASHLGSQGGWRHHAGLAACEVLIRLDRHAEPELARDGLGELRLAGATKELTLAARRVAEDGPATAAADALKEADLVLSTRTTARADLALLKTAGHLADEATSARAVEQLLAILGGGVDYLKRTSAPHGILFELLDALAGIAPAGGTATREAIREHILSLDSIQDQAVATGYAKVARALPLSSWNEDAAARAARAAEAHNEALGVQLLGFAARRDTAALSQLIDRSREGSLDAAAAVGDVRKIPDDAAGVLTGKLAESVRSVVADARTGTFGIGLDVGRQLVVLNACNPDVAEWEPVLELLAGDQVLPFHKVGALRSLRSLIERVPPEVRSGLIPIARRIARREGPPPPVLFDHSGDVVRAAAAVLLALDAMDPEEVAHRLIEYLGGDSADRREAAQVAARIAGQEGRGILVALSDDGDARVRAAAAEGLARIIATHDVDPITRRALEACVADPGWLVPAETAATLFEVGGPIAESFLASLRRHPSAYVRRAALGPET